MHVARHMFNLMLDCFAGLGAGIFVGAGIGALMIMLDSDEITIFVCSFITFMFSFLVVAYESHESRKQNEIQAR